MNKVLLKFYKLHTSISDYILDLKLSNMYGNTELWLGVIKDNPKKSLTVLISILLALYMGYKAVTRVPSAVGCLWTAEVSQSVEWDKWRFNWMDNSCQYLSNNRWIPIERVIDVGAGEDLGNVE